MKILRLEREAAEITLKKGVVFHSPSFSVRFLKNPLKQSYFTVVVPKKEEKTAVGRNKIKRRIRAVFSKILKTKPVWGNLMVFGKKPAKISSFSNLTLETEGVLSKIQAL